MPYTAELGRLIRTLRSGVAFMTEAQLGAKVGVHRTTVSRWERGEMLPSVRQLGKLGKHLHVKTAELGAARLRDLASRNGERLMVGGIVAGLGAHALIAWHVAGTIARGLGLA